jgi:hypothetical protein
MKTSMDKTEKIGVLNHKKVYKTTYKPLIIGPINK